tara:strand:+ start:942 stop:1625 length:684 start_codon:yes stop_codon:yes gene_type:complete
LKTIVLFILFISSSFLFAQKKSESLKGSDITFSLGAGKNRFLESEENGKFLIAAPIELPVNINIGISKKVEIGAEWAPIIFNDKSSYNFEGYDSTKNKFGGYLQSMNLNLLYSLNNSYRMNGYLQLNGGYSSLHKKQYISGDFNELVGEGYNWSFGGGLRYQLGNMYDDVFPWFFDFSLVYTRFNLQIDKYAIDNVIQPKTESSWNDLNFGSIDVVIRIGYRIRLKK